MWCVPCEISAKIALWWIIIIIGINGGKKENGGIESNSGVIKLKREKKRPSFK